MSPGIFLSRYNFKYHAQKAGPKLRCLLFQKERELNGCGNSNASFIIRHQNISVPWPLPVKECWSTMIMVWRPSGSFCDQGGIIQLAMSFIDALFLQQPGIFLCWSWVTLRFSARRRRGLLSQNLWWQITAYTSSAFDACSDFCTAEAYACTVFSFQSLEAGYGACPFNVKRKEMICFSAK